MKRVKVSTAFPDWPWGRQLPNNGACWGECQFFIDSDEEECDWWIVLEGLSRREVARCPATNVLFLAFEHPEVKQYHPGFLAQFPKVRSCNSRIEHPGHTTGTLGFPWHAGIRRSDERAVLSYDHFVEMRRGAKPKLLSMVCSNKVITPAQRLRVRLAESLKRHFGDSIDVFGRGFHEIDDKWDAIHPYKYHVVIENGAVEHWWTEKLADAYLGLSFPFYWGCPNVADYFPRESMVLVDVGRPKEVIRKIEEVISMDLFETNSSSIYAARDAVLNEYNLFAILDKITSTSANADSQLIAIDPEQSFGNYGKTGMVQRVKKLGSQILRNFFYR